MARSLVRRYTAASSLVSKPTITLGSSCGGSRLSTASRTLGLNFAAQPAAFAVGGSRTCSANVIAPWNRFDDYSARMVANSVRNSPEAGSVSREFKLRVRGGRANGNGDGFGRFAGREHVAAAVEDGAGLHDQAWRVNFAGHDRLGLNFDFAGGFDDAVEVPADDDVVAVNLPFHTRVLAEDQGFV